MPFKYKPKTIQQIKNSYSQKVNNGVNGFNNLEDFLIWYQEQDLNCHYCGLKEKELQEISMTGILTSKRFPQKGVIGRGTNRAVWLEIDRLIPSGLYSRKNCVLSCYFCNNDKSDIFNGDIYAAFFQNRVSFLRQLLIKKRANK